MVDWSNYTLFQGARAGLRYYPVKGRLSRQTDLMYNILMRVLAATGSGSAFRYHPVKEHFGSLSDRLSAERGRPGMDKPFPYENHRTSNLAPDPWHVKFETMNAYTR